MVRIVCLGVWRYDALPRRHERRKGTTYHDTWVLGASNNGREDGAGRIVTRKASLAHTRAIVNNESLG